MQEITKEMLQSRVPDRIFWRGEDLYNDGAVQTVDVSEKQITAKVLGSRLYTVKAELLNDNFLFSCTCPYDGFCKHRIALGLWMIDNKSRISKMMASQETKTPKPDIRALIKQATPEQKDTFLIEALNEFPVLQSRFDVMIKGVENLGSEIDIDALAAEIKTKMEAFDLQDYTRFYESAPDDYGYREDWEVLQDGAEAEFDALFNSYKDRVVEFLKIRNIIGSFKYLLAIYEAVKTVEFERVDDPACIFETDGLYDLAETNLAYLIEEFIADFAALSFEESVYLQLIEIFFERFAKKGKKQIYRIPDFTGFFLSCIQSDRIAAHLLKRLQKAENLAEEEYRELLLAVYEKTNEKEKWLVAAEKYYKINQTAAEKLLNHFASNKKELLRLAENIAFRFDKKFIPFFYEHLNKEDNPDLYRKILTEYAAQTQTVKLFRELKKDYGKEAAREFIDSLENKWNMERFFIQLLQEEKAYEKLLSIAQKESRQSPAMVYLRPIVNIYPEQVFEIISIHAENILDENTGRNYYRQAAEWLRLLKQIKDEKVRKKTGFFINHLLGKFSNRRAMKDEFEKAKII